MELVTRQSERSGHQQRLLQAFTEDVFYFQLTRVHSALEHSEQCALQIYLFKYLLTYLLKYTLNTTIAHTYFFLSSSAFLPRKFQS